MNSVRLGNLEAGLQSSTSLSVVHWYQEVDSTMDVAREFVTALALGGSGLIVASHQRAGRGRRGRVWVSETGALMATYMHRIPLQIPACGGLSLAVGVAVYRYLVGIGVNARLKWPNDILTAERLKLAGILIELIPQGAGDLCLLVGVGMNLKAAPPEVPVATSLAAQGACGITPYDALLDLTPHWLSILEQFISQGFAAVRDEWIQGAAIVGQQVSVQQGTQRIDGIVADIGFDGSLRLRDAQGRVTSCYSGEVAIGS